VFRAIHDGKPDQGLLAYQYLQTLPKIAQGDANKMWIVPSEFNRALEGLAKLGGADGEGRSWMDVPATGNGAAPAAEGLDTSGWFESQLPPAADQPEARIELHTIEETPLPTLEVPHPPSLASAVEDAGTDVPPAGPDAP
jgi:hypothetical protein